MSDGFYLQIQQTSVPDKYTVIECLLQNLPHFE